MELHAKLAEKAVQYLYEKATKSDGFVIDTVLYAWVGGDMLDDFGAFKKELSKHSNIEDKLEDNRQFGVHRKYRYDSRGIQLFVNLEPDEKEDLIEELAALKNVDTSYSKLSEIAKERYRVRITDSAIYKTLCRSELYAQIDPVVKDLLDVIYGTARSVLTKSRYYTAGNTLMRKMGGEHQEELAQIVNKLKEGPEAFDMGTGDLKRLSVEKTRTEMAKRIATLMPLGELVNIVEGCISYNDLHHWLGYEGKISQPAFKTYMIAVKKLTRKQE